LNYNGLECYEHFPRGFVYTFVHTYIILPYIRLDEHLSQRVATAPRMETVIEEIQKALETACRSSFRIWNISQKAISHKSVPWWTKILTILRKN